MPRVFVSVGSNIEPEKNVREALKKLKDHVRVKAISTFYLNDADGREDQDQFYNGVIEIDTDLHPTELRELILHRIEDELGRERTEDKFAARTMDLDVLVYGDLVGQAGDLVLPEPEIQHRAFLAVPLAELAPDMELPSTGKTMKEVAESFAEYPMETLNEYTEMLRTELADGS